MNNLSKINRFKSLAALVVIIVMLFTGLGITNAAAKSSIPGDALYGVKTMIEQTRLNLATDAGDRAQMRMRYAEQRLEEIRQLIKEGRNREIGPAVLAFEVEINQAILELEIVAKGDPARAASLALDITSALTRYATTLSVMAATAPDSVRSEVARALDSTQLASSLDMPERDDNSLGENINNGNENANIDNSGDNDNGNIGNGNDNSDDHGNDNNDIDNGNDNGDDHGNDNGDIDNGNDNGDDHGNDNGDIDNGNDNGDDHGDINNDNSNDDNHQDLNNNNNNNDDNHQDLNNNNNNNGGNDNNNDNSGGDDGKDSGRKGKDG